MSGTFRLNLRNLKYRIPCLTYCFSIQLYEILLECYNVGIISWGSSCHTASFTDDAHVNPSTFRTCWVSTTQICRISFGRVMIGVLVLWLWLWLWLLLLLLLLWVKTAPQTPDSTSIIHSQRSSTLTSRKRPSVLFLHRQVMQGHWFWIWNHQTQPFWNPLFVWFETTIHFGCFKCTKVCSVGYFDPSILGLLGGEVITGQLGWPKPWIESNVDVMHLRSYMTSIYLDIMLAIAYFRSTGASEVLVQLKVGVSTKWYIWYCMRSSLRKQRCTYRVTLIWRSTPAANLGGNLICCCWGFFLHPVMLVWFNMPVTWRSTWRNMYSQ